MIPIRIVYTESIDSKQQTSGITSPLIRHLLTAPVMRRSDTLTTISHVMMKFRIRHSWISQVSGQIPINSPLVSYVMETISISQMQRVMLQIYKVLICIIQQTLLIPTGALTAITRLHRNTMVLHSHRSHLRS